MTDQWLPSSGCCNKLFQSCTYAVKSAPLRPNLKGQIMHASEIPVDTPPPPVSGLSGMHGLPLHNQPKKSPKRFFGPSFSSDEAATKVPLATVYQKHRSLLTRDEDV